MSTIKIGDRVVQTTDRSGRIRGGIDSESRLDQNPQRTKTDTQIVQDQIKKIKDIEEQFKGVDDNRAKFLALSTPKATFEAAQNRRIQNRRRAEVLDALKIGKNVDRSLFTGREPKEGTKSSILNAFGIGTVSTGKPKLREGLSSADYAEFMGKAFEANPGMMESLFPFASGRTIRNVSRLAPGIGTLQNLASAAKEKTGGFLNRFFPGLLPSSGITTTKQAQPTLAELAENAFRFASFRSAPTNIKDIKKDNALKNQIDQLSAIKLFSGFPGTQQNIGIGTPMISSSPEITSLFQLPFRKGEIGFQGDLTDQIIQQSKTPPNIDVSMEGIAPVLNTSNNLNQTGSTAPLLGNASIAQQKEFFERAIRGNVAGVPDRIGEIYQNLLDSGALSTTEALQYGSFVRNLPPPSNTYGLSPEIKPGIEGIDLKGNFPGVL
tara:strand:- start:20 stop:1327 length:1308 start_codon:yes stop_codon:yes gene_type:complete